MRWDQTYGNGTKVKHLHDGVQLRSHRRTMAIWQERPEGDRILAYASAQGRSDWLVQEVINGRYQSATVYRFKDDAIASMIASATTQLEREEGIPLGDKTIDTSNWTRLAEVDEIAQEKGITRADAVRQLVNHALSNGGLDGTGLPDELAAQAVAVSQVDMIKGGGVELLMRLRGRLSGHQVAMAMYPPEARRHALRILQTCELAEGRQGVNA